MTILAASILAESLDHGLAQASAASEQGADMVEFRLDIFPNDPDAIARLITQSPLPCTITCRPKWEGGKFQGSEDERLKVLAIAAKHNPAHIDIELNAFRRSAAGREIIDSLVSHPEDEKANTPDLIISSHDFDKRPADLLQQLEFMAEQDCCSIIKLVWHAHSLKDNLEAFELLLSPHKPTVALCMGEFGLPSRILAKKFDAFLSFASINDTSATAPGQTSVEEMIRLYRWKKINNRTAVLGVIGYPIGHSLSPHIFNAGFDQTDYNGTYLPLPISPEYEQFKDVIESWISFRPLRFRGASVTIPHKENLIRFVSEKGGRIDPLAKAIGAANTLSIKADGSVRASNTDCMAALDGLCNAIDITRQQLDDASIAVIGAGGVARAVVAGFAQYSSNVTIYNRTLTRAEALADDFNEHPVVENQACRSIKALSLDQLPISTHDIYINCTSVGMYPNTDESPLNPLPDSANENTVFFDTVYNPINTMLLRQAAQRGCVTVSGIEMFIRQAAEQFQIWTGKTPPLDLFRSVMIKHL